MDATKILLKYLKSKCYIDDIESAKTEVKTATVDLKNETDLFIRDSILGLGTILKEDLENHYYITTIKVGKFGNVITQAIIMRNGKKADIAVYAHEGIIKQQFADKAIKKILDVLN